MKIYFLVRLQAEKYIYFPQHFFLFGRKMPHDAEILKKPLKKRSLKGNATNFFLCEGKEKCILSESSCDAGILPDLAPKKHLIVENNRTRS